MSKVPKGGMTADKFAEILAHRKWQRIEDMVSALDNAGYWEEIAETAVTRWKKEHCRQMARSLKRKDGRSVFVHVEKILPDGKKVHVYKQQTLFDVSDYAFAVSYHKRMGFHHMGKANQLARDCRQFLGKQMPLPFPSLAPDVAA